MADTFGAVTLPIPTTGSPIGDPALGYVATYLGAILNDVAASAWAALRPRGTTHSAPVIQVVTNDPRKGRFNSNQLPALFVWRQRGTFEDRSLDWIEETSTVRALWVFPPDPQEKAAPRFAFASALAKAVSLRLARGRDPVWQADGDDDATALDVDADADAIVTSRATKVIAETLSGADLNGAIGGDTMSPRLEPTVTTAVASAIEDDPGIPNFGDDGPALDAVYNCEDAIVVTFVDWNGTTRTREILLTEPNGGETIGLGEDVASVTSIAIPAQVSTTGFFQFGTAERVGRGSIVTRLANLLCPPRLREWAPEPIEISVYGADGIVTQRLQYDAVGMTIELREHGFTDYEQHVLGGTAGADGFVGVDGFDASQFSFDAA